MRLARLGPLAVALLTPPKRRRARAPRKVSQFLPFERCGACGRQAFADMPATGEALCEGRYFRGACA